MSASEKPVNYCYKCGKKLRPGVASCWFCSSPTIRVIRPARLCPYCQEKIGAKAIKCPHCGEFVDGRPAAAHYARQGPTVLIDKAVFADGRMLAMGGQGGAGQGFDPGRALAPEQYGQQALPGSGQEYLPPPPALLPAPDSAGGEAEWEGHVESEPNSRALAPRRGQGALAGQAYPLAPSGGAAHLPAPYAGGAPGPPLAPAKNKGQPAEIEGELEQAPRPPADDESKYAICGICQTEILATDLYCFHCGQVQAKARRNEKPVFIGPSNKNHYVFACLLYGLYAFLKHPPQMLSELAAMEIEGVALNGPLVLGSLLVGGLLMSVWCFFRRRRLASQAISVALAVLGIWLWAS